MPKKLSLSSLILLIVAALSVLTTPLFYGPTIATYAVTAFFTALFLFYTHIWLISRSASVVERVLWLCAAVIVIVFFFGVILAAEETAFWLGGIIPIQMEPLAISMVVIVFLAITLMTLRVALDDLERCINRTFEEMM